MSYDRFNAYRVMWLFIFFDLPTNNKAQRKAASKFRKALLSDGFQMFQFSIYLRHCPSRENAAVHTERVKRHLPKYGHIGILQITDKQFGRMILFEERQEKPKPLGPQQLELF